ncbi:hypothetical protein [Aerosakkonema funiforme]|uniref:hypothetical protein n=1 Tax=Aerosakkonema funiforme TaxID=1246630 RepID=UPI0035B6E4C4
MNQQPRIPDPQTKARTVARLRETCQMLDALNVFLDDAISQVEAENHRNPLYIRRLQKAEELLDSRKQENLEKQKVQ